MYRVNIENIDISHKSRRTQKGNIELVKKLEGTEEETLKESVEEPKGMTLERAIKYFESHSESNEGLFKQTANWLREYLILRSSKKE